MGMSHDGVMPPDANKKLHPIERGQGKVALDLCCIYGAGVLTVARVGDVSPSQAQFYLSRHREIYSAFWKWRKNVIFHAGHHEYMRTPLGWQWYVDGNVRSTTASNWLMQSAGADMLRLATCLSIERRVKVVGVLHDAIRIVSPMLDFDSAIDTATKVMNEASRVVLGQGELRVDWHRLVYPDPFIDEKRRPATEPWLRWTASPRVSGGAMPRS